MALDNVRALLLLFPGRESVFTLAITEQAVVLLKKGNWE
jgi:hypothetical protein